VRPFPRPLAHDRSLTLSSWRLSLAGTRALLGAATEDLVLEWQQSERDQLAGERRRRIGSGLGRLC